MTIEYINVRYQNDRSDIVPLRFLDKLIASNKITKFYRESEKRWVRIGVDLIREVVSIYYMPERRSPLKARVSFNDFPSKL